MDGELGGEEQALLETELRDAGWTWAEWGGAELSRAWPLTLQGKETCLPAIAGSVGAGDSCSRAPIPGLRRPIPNSRSPRLGEHTATNKQDSELPGCWAL